MTHLHVCLQMTKAAVREEACMHCSLILIHSVKKSVNTLTSKARWISSNWHNLQRQPTENTRKILFLHVHALEH